VCLGCGHRYLPEAFAALTQLTVVQSTSVGMTGVRDGRFLDMVEFVGVEFALTDQER
jgi:hypothetical protein